MVTGEEQHIEVGVDYALKAWRQRATEVVLIVALMAHLPACILMLLNLGPRLTPAAKAVTVSVYFVILVCKLLTRVGYRKRLAALIVAVYLFVTVAIIAVPHGPWAQLGPVVMPLVTLVLAGARWGRITAATSGAILIAAPLARQLPWVSNVLVAVPDLAAGPATVAWSQVVVQGGVLISMVILLEQLHRFLQDGLARQHHGKAELEAEMRERQRLEREIAGIGDRERQKLGHELHDGVCQQVTAALLRCQTLERRVAHGATLTEEDFGPLSSLLGDVIDDTRGVAMGLCPLESDAEALAPALKALTRQMEKLAGVRCDFVARGDLRVPDSDRSHHLYRITQEALSNAVRHACASRILVELRGEGDELRLKVEDNGTGIQTGRALGMGMRTMGYRVQVLGGELKVAPAPGGGTRVCCRVPRISDGNSDQPWSSAQ